MPSVYFCDTLSFLNTKKYPILETFLGAMLSRVSTQAEISSLFEQAVSPLDHCAIPP